LDADQRTLTTWRDLHLIHAPQLFQGRRFRHAISEILVMPQNGELVHPGESERLHEYRQRQAEVERRRRQVEQAQAQRQRSWQPSIADRPAQGPQEPQQIREVVKPGWMALLETPTKPSGELEQHAGHQEAVCEICGTKTTDWWYFDGKTGRCRCRTCRDQGKC
jgi:hypothetical protein